MAGGFRPTASLVRRLDRVADVFAAALADMAKKRAFWPINCF